MAAKFRFQHPEHALESLVEKLAPVVQKERTSESTGRVLASPVTADRDSPAADVSAMDGYAIRMSELQTDQPVSIEGESSPGAPPPTFQPGKAVRIFTGAIVPSGAEAVIKREDTIESGSEIQFLDAALKNQLGQHIRRAGENALAGSDVVEAGTLLNAAHQATLANFGCSAADVYHRVRVAVLTTGDEVGIPEGESPEPWQLRNSNRASIAALLNTFPWIRVCKVSHAVDQREILKNEIQQCLTSSDALLLTGGVSMGDYDYVPEVIREVGGEILFHGLPIRPGRPILGAATADGKLILGLPGNPVSATVGCRRMALPLLAKISGQQVWNRPRSVVRLSNPSDKTIPLHWMKLVRLTEPGIAEVVSSQGSGDLVALGRSDGFVELPPDQTGEGPWPYFSWSD
ncbi:MAG: molybdopterin molybdotransferase MoeA [Planctomycetota bacterium]